MELITLYLQGKCSSTEIHPQPPVYKLSPCSLSLHHLCGLGHTCATFLKKKQQRRFYVSKIGKTIAKVLLK